MHPPSLLRRGQSLWLMVTDLFDSLRPAAALSARLYLAQVFFLAGLTKIRDWDITLLLFTEEYKVPLLSPEVAAVLGTGAELVLPILLVLGLVGRFAAVGLSVVNFVAVLSLSDIAPAALQQHITWGVLLAVLVLYGLGKWTIDCMWFRPRIERRLAQR
jgi:putative oxidoreductase